MMIPNSTQVPNIIFDDLMSGLTDTELRVLLVIVRQTLGWIENPITKTRKEKDWISYSQLKEKTGRQSEALSNSLRGLEDKKLIEVFDKEGNRLLTKEARLGKALFYRFSTSSKTEEVKKSSPNLFGNRNSKTEDTKETVTKDTFTKVNEGASIYKNNWADKSKQTMTELLKEKARSLQVKTVDSDNRINQKFQAYAVEAVKLAGLKNGGRARLFQLFKINNYGHQEVKKTEEVVMHQNYKMLTTEDQKVRYLAGAYK